jgi:hypothetical protein
MLPEEDWIIFTSGTFNSRRKALEAWLLQEVMRRQNGLIHRDLME